MKRSQRGRIFTRTSGGSFYCQWYLNGKQFVRALRDADGKPITQERAARKAADALVRPYLATDRAELRQAAVNALRDATEVAQAAERAARPRLRIADAWSRHPYVRSRRGDVERDLAESSVADNRQLWARFERWAAAAGVEYIESVTPEHAALYRESLIGEGLSGHRVNLAVLAARVMLDLAGVDPNPFARLRRRANIVHGHRELTAEELAKVCQSATGELRTLLAVGTFTGLRLGDACTLAWSEVAPDLGTIIRIPNKTSYRGKALTIPCHPVLQAILAELPRGAGAVMPTLAERYTRQRALIALDLRRHFEACGITTSEDAPGRKRKACVAGFHSLRHAFVSCQARAGIPEHVVRELVGHTSPMVHAIYQHTNGADRQRAIASLPTLTAAPALPPADPARSEAPRERFRRLADALPIEAIERFLAQVEKGGVK